MEKQQQQQGNICRCVQASNTINTPDSRPHCPKREDSLRGSKHKCNNYRGLQLPGADHCLTAEHEESRLGALTKEPLLTQRRETVALYQFFLR